MPKSKKRKKNGKAVRSSAASREQRIKDAPTGVTLQELINVLAYQEYVADGTIEPKGKLEIDTEDPDTQAIIKAVHAASDSKIEQEKA